MRRGLISSKKLLFRFYSTYPAFGRAEFINSIKFADLANEEVLVLTPNDGYSIDFARYVTKSVCLENAPLPPAYLANPSDPKISEECKSIIDQVMDAYEMRFKIGYASAKTMEKVRLEQSLRPVKAIAKVHSVLSVLGNMYMPPEFVLAETRMEDYILAGWSRPNPNIFYQIAGRCDYSVNTNTPLKHFWDPDVFSNQEIKMIEKDLETLRNREPNVVLDDKGNVIERKKYETIDFIPGNFQQTVPYMVGMIDYENKGVNHLTTPMIFYMCALLVAQAYCKGLSAPAVIQGFISDGDYWRLMAFQLNTLRFDEEEGRRNVIWIKDYPMYTYDQSIDRYEMNAEVLRILLKMMQLPEIIKK